MTIDQSQALYSGRMLETLNYMRCKEANKIVPSVTMSGVSPNVSYECDSTFCTFCYLKVNIWFHVSQTSLLF